MNLEGSLGAFGLHDVFALLAMTGKSGGLRLRDPQQSAPVAGVVWFHDGKVTGASADEGRLGLVRRLVGSGAVDDDALVAAVGRAEASPVGVARALLEAGAVEPELLREAATDQAVDAVFDLIRWEGGEFGFEPGARNIDDVGIALEHTWLIAEAQARSRAWDDLRAVIPSLGSIVAMPVVLAEDPTLSRDEWALLALVDGRRTVADLIELTGCGQFAVATVLAGLARRGLLSVIAGDGSDHVATVVRRLRLLGESGAETVAAPAVPAASAGPAAPAGQVESAVGRTPAEPVETVTAAPDPEPVPMAAGPVVAPAPAEPPAAERDPEPAAQPWQPAASIGAAGINAADALAAVRAAQRQNGQGGPGVAPARREVVPPRPEPFLPGRRPDHPDAPLPARTGAAAGRPGADQAGTIGHSNPAGSNPAGPASMTPTAGNTAMVPAQLPVGQGIIERDPAVNRSLLLRLIAGVRGL